MPTIAVKPLTLLIAALLALPVAANETDTANPEEKTTTDSAHENAETMVVTGTRMSEPLTVATDPRTPRQPLPAHDGADYLKTISGFSVTRKGGTDGDPVFRGMAGSRLNILVDGGNILGGCNARMDAPTAYIFPEMYNQLTVIKGPQTVLYGSGNAAGTVMFERDPLRFEQADSEGYASAVVGSFGRYDAIADLAVGSQHGYAQLLGSYSTADDYEDGDGNAVHSAYERYNGNAVLGWTPGDNSRVELAVGQSDGEAAYADRAMDGSKFLRESSALLIQHDNLTDWLSMLKLQLNDSQVDHIMDDQSLRQPGMMGYANLLRDTQGARLGATLIPTAIWQIETGIDWQNNSHDSRSAPPSGVYRAWQNDAGFEQRGLFAELSWDASGAALWRAGLRQDNWQAHDERVSTGGMMPIPNPTYGQSRDEDLVSGFLRYEHRNPQSPTVWYVGVGQAARFPDYWEMIAKESASSRSAFATESETTRQLDIGFIRKTGVYETSLSVFSNKVDDYILIDYSNPMKVNGVARNIDANSWGGEWDAKLFLSPNWVLDGGLAYVHGSNDTDNTPLAQQPPLELRGGLTYDNRRWSVGALLRLVDEQDRYDLNKGNIVGRDLGPSDSFAVFSINGGWRLSSTATLSAGIDNLFNETYAEFISRAGGNGVGGSIPGYLQTTRVNEPGRTGWLKASVAF